MNRFASVATNTGILDNQWHDIIGVYSATTLRIYLDGVLQNSTGFIVPPANNSGDLFFGEAGATGSNHFHGLIDEVGILPSGSLERSTVCVPTSIRIARVAIVSIAGAWYGAGATAAEAATGTTGAVTAGFAAGAATGATGFATAGFGAAALDGVTTPSDKIAANTITVF